MRKLLSLSLPMAGIQLVTVAGGFLCMAMLAQLGQEVLAASALIYSTQMSMMVIGMSLLFSLSILIGHAYGAEKHSVIGNFVQQGWMLSILLGGLIILFFLHIGTILIFFGQKLFIAHIVQTFFDAYVWAVIPVLWVVTNQQFCYGIKYPKLIIMTTGTGVIVLLGSAYLLIFGKFGFPKLGVAGLGYAMAAQAWTSFLLSTTCFYYMEHFKHFDLFTYRVHKSWEHLAHMMKVGWPISIQITGEMFSFFVSTAIVGWLGVQALAASQVNTQYFLLVLIPIFVLSQASGILVGHACGSKQWGELKKIGSSSLYLVTGISVFVGIIFIGFPKTLASLYLDVNAPENATTVRLIELVLMVSTLTVLFDAIKNVMTGALRGLLDSKFPMFVGLATIWLLGLPLGYFLAFKLNFGLIGMAIGSAIGMFVGAVILIYRWRKKVSYISL